MHYIPGLRLRCDEETEILGVDEDQIGEWAYDYAYVNRSIEEGDVRPNHGLSLNMNEKVTDLQKQSSTSYYPDSSVSQDAAAPAQQHHHHHQQHLAPTQASTLDTEAASSYPPSGRHHPNAEASTATQA